MEKPARCENRWCTSRTKIRHYLPDGRLTFLPPPPPRFTHHPAYSIVLPIEKPVRNRKRDIKTARFHFSDYWTCDYCHGSETQPTFTYPTEPKDHSQPWYSYLKPSPLNATIDTD